ncbi:MAG TPA: polyprenol monophosphomannose synthase [bacterium]|nr:polyprenol monophosphomannose synthase [bacterium]
MKSSGFGKTIIVVPTYNEKGNIEMVYRKIFKAARSCHLLIVDDNSPDGTGRMADGIAQKDKRVFVLHRQGKLGLGSAYVEGMKYALQKGYRNVIAMDADLSHDPTNLPKMIEMVQKHDLVIGSRYVKDGGMVNWNARRFLISQLANLFCRSILGLKQADCSGGFKCYRSSLLEKIGMDRVFSKGYNFQVEILYRAVRTGASIVEIPIIFVDRHVGESKLNMGELLAFGWTLVKLRFLAWLGRI